MFISHSSGDKGFVRSIVAKANSQGMSCYVDWTSDNDFLKRSMVSDYTKEVLKVRMNQSKHLLYLSSHRSRNSEWVSFELDYYENCLHREILMIVLDGDDGHDFRRIDLEATGKSLLGDLSN